MWTHHLLSEKMKRPWWRSGINSISNALNSMGQRVKVICYQSELITCQRFDWMLQSSSDPLHLCMSQLRSHWKITIKDSTTWISEEYEHPAWSTLILSFWTHLVGIVCQWPSVPTIAQHFWTVLTEALVFHEGLSITAAQRLSAMSAFTEYRPQSITNNIGRNFSSTEH